MPKGHCYGNQLILWAKIERGLIPPLFLVLAFHNSMKYCHLNACINSSHELGTLCKNVVNFDSVTLRDYMAHLHTFVPVVLY